VQSYPGRLYRAVGASMREAEGEMPPVGNPLNPTMVFPGCEYFYN